MKIDIIGGKEEAALISSTDLNELISKDKTYLYVDVGGGSTELSLLFPEETSFTQNPLKLERLELLNNSKQENKEKFNERRALDQKAHI